WQCLLTILKSCPRSVSNTSLYPALTLVKATHPRHRMSGVRRGVGRYPVAFEAGNHCRYVPGGGFQDVGAAGPHDDLGREPLAVVFGIGSYAGFRMGVLDLREQRADIAFAIRAGERLRQHPCARTQGRKNV